MSEIATRRAQDLLREFEGKSINSVNIMEFQLRLAFSPYAALIVFSAWRILHRDEAILGSGDGDAERLRVEPEKRLQGLKVISTSVSPSCDSQLVFEQSYQLQMFADSVAYETWEAHSEKAHALFSGGEITIFPPVVWQKNQ